MLRARGHAHLSAVLASSTTRGLMGMTPAATAATAAAPHAPAASAAFGGSVLSHRRVVGVRYAGSLAPAQSSSDAAILPGVPAPPSQLPLHAPRTLPHFASVPHPQFLPPSTDLASGMPVLTRPGTELLQPARVPFKPHRALPPHVQALLDSRLIEHRRRTNPDWLDKQHVRKMTLVERKALLLEYNREIHLEIMDKLISRCENNMASLHCADRAHEWFFRVYTYAPVQVYHSMIKIAGSQRLYLRMDAYFAEMLVHQSPTVGTFSLLMDFHADNGHTAKIEELIQRMQTGKSTAEQAEEAAKAEAAAALAAASNKIVDPTDGRSKVAKRLEKNTAIQFAFNEKALVSLLRCHAYNNDTASIVALLRKLEAKEPLYPYQVKDLRLTIRMAEVTMHYFGLQRAIPEAIALLRWVSRDSLPVTPLLAWHFFECFKREITVRGMVANPSPEMQEEIKQETNRRMQAPPRVAPVPSATPIAAAQGAPAQATLPATATGSVPAVFDPTVVPPAPAPALQYSYPVAGRVGVTKAPVRSPFPREADALSVWGPGHIPVQSVNRKRSRMSFFQPSPVDKRKEKVPFREVMQLMLLEHGFVPSATLIHAYLSYYGSNLLPPEIFPDVMGSQTKVFEEMLNAETIQKVHQQHPPTADLAPAVEGSDVESRTAFIPTAQTYALLIQALMDRKPLRGFSPASLALHPFGPSRADQRRIMSYRAEMKARHIEPLLPTKISMMALMVLDERWEDIYAAYLLLWKAEKLRKEDIAKQRQHAPAGGVQTPDEPRKDAVEPVDDDVSAPMAFSAASAPFDCMALLPVFLYLAARPTLDRFNYFLSIVSSSSDFPLSPPFFQAILSVLADRGESSQIIKLLRTMNERYKIRTKTNHFNALLASLVHTDDALATPDQIQSGVLRLPVRDPALVMVNLFQTWQLMRLLKFRMNDATYTAMLTGCLHFGEYADAKRVWKFMTSTKTTSRPSLMHYTLYIEILLKHHRLHDALYILRGQSMVDGLDYSLRECHAILDYLQTSLLQHVSGAPQVHPRKRPTSEAEKAMLRAKGVAVPDDNVLAHRAESGSDLTTAQRKAVYVPNERQVRLYKLIQSQCVHIAQQLLKFEKSGGVLAQDQGHLDYAVPGLKLSRVAQLHRQSASVTHRALHSTLEQKESDSVVELSTMDQKLFGRHFAPLLQKIWWFIGPTQKRMKMVAEQQKLLAAPAGNQEAGSSQSTDGNAAAAELSDRAPVFDEEMADPDEVEADEAEADEIAEASAAMEAGAALDETVAPSVSDAAVVAESASAPPAELSEAEVQSKTDALLTQIESAVAKEKANMAQAERAAAVASFVPAPPAAAEAAPAEAAAAPSSAVVPPPPAATASSSLPSPVFVSVSSALRALNGHAKKTVAPTDSLAAPRHPAMINGVDLCALREADNLAQLTMPMLKAVQTDAQLMNQPKIVVQGIKSHHLKVVAAWLEHCSCCNKK